NELIKIANYLDERFCAEEADELTAVAQRLAQVAEVPWEDLDAPSRGPEWELGEDEYLREQDARSEIAQMEYDDAMRIVQELMPRIDS
ncbi:hypothetical protein, partial [Streptomyces acidiscabies]|uniref:hypothetical protein n=1 Tax=Streptomyces acidiscabies TaxID=42234 RepID=UPI0038F64316